MYLPLYPADIVSNFLKMDLQISIIDSDRNRVGKAIDGQELFLVEAIGQDPLLFQINHPVLTNPGILVLVCFDHHIFLLRGRREDFNNHIRCPETAFPENFAPVTYDKNIRLDNRAVIPVQLNINGRDERDAGPLLLQH